MSAWLATTLSVGFAGLVCLSLWLFRSLDLAERLSLRLRSVRSIEPSGVPARNGPPLVRMVTRMGELIASSGALSEHTLEELRQTLYVAGFRGAKGLGLFVGTKLLLLIALPAAVLILPLLLGRELPYRAIAVPAAVVIGLVIPDIVLRRIRRRYLAALDSGIPDALDMMVICGQAGLGMETSIERVGIEIRHAHAQVADELTRTAHEMQVNVDTRLALLNLSKRTGLDSMRRLATVLIQSMQFGTPLSQALRALAAEQRQEMLAKFEAKAGRLPVLLTLPMIIFILPCVFLVVAGPAMVDVYRAMHK
jgi:tight adherence protein C